MLYDLHIHSCLSPCASDDMTPATIAGIAKLEGADIIAITDHNSALNLPAARAACNEYNLKLLPGIEVTTQEEIHVLCYFNSVETALSFGKMLYSALIILPYDENIWGKQLIMDEHDNVIGKEKTLLSGPVNLNIYEVKKQCEQYGGIAVPAHVDKQSTSITSVLGFMPDDLDFAAMEYMQKEAVEQFIEKGFLPNKKELLISSDAHFIGAIASNLQILNENSALLKLIEQL